MSAPQYIGRFAPSPTGPLHAGSLVTALASWLDARAHGGQWLVRIEDVDLPRCVQGAEETIFLQLAACGLLPDEYEPVRQSARGHAYRAALERLNRLGLTYPCGCTRRAIEDAMVSLGLLHERFEERVYPGTCRTGLHGKPARATRVLTVCGGMESVIHWTDRRLGPQRQNVAREVGDFVIQRADGLWAYQLAVVVDDAYQGITDVVRGEDLADNTARQIHLQHLLGLPELRYLHTPLVMGRDGHKLSKQNDATPLDISRPLRCLAEAARVLDLPAIGATNLSEWLTTATQAWGARWLKREAGPTVPGRMA
jgi:glutamyl-Q tRNA(Asp) synthetase